MPFCRILLLLFSANNQINTDLFCWVYTIIRGPFSHSDQWKAIMFSSNALLCPDLHNIFYLFCAFSLYVKTLLGLNVSCSQNLFKEVVRTLPKTWNICGLLRAKDLFPDLCKINKQKTLQTSPHISYKHT